MTTTEANEEPGVSPHDLLAVALNLGHPSEKPTNVDFGVSVSAI
jgi:hypothetical protein